MKNLIKENFNANLLIKNYKNKINHRYPNIKVHWGLMWFNRLCLVLINERYIYRIHKINTIIRF